LGLKVQPEINNKNEWHMTVYTDSDWAGDKESRHSVSGYVMFLMGVPILWKSRSQKTISLSSSEAEYYALSEAAKEIKFIVQILNSIGIKITMPIVVRVDNVGAIFISENNTATSRTKHIDVRYHYVREFIEDGFIKIVFVRSADNKSDMFTKNISSDVYENHIDDFVIKKGKMDSDREIEGRVLEGHNVDGHNVVSIPRSSSIRSSTSTSTTSTGTGKRVHWDLPNAELLKKKNG
jgi:hypothetical protein